MKNLHCFTSIASELSRCFVYVYEKETQAVAEKFKPKEDTETLPVYADIEKTLSDQMDAVRKKELESIKSGHAVSQAAEKKELDAIDQTTVKGKKEYADKKKKFDDNDKKRHKELTDANNAFTDAEVAAIWELQKTINEAHEKRKKAAEGFSNSMMKELMDAETANRKANADKDVDQYLSSYYTFQDKVSMPNFRKLEGGGISNVGGPDWNGDQVKNVTREMVKAIYIDLGPKAAQDKLAELMKSCSDVKEANRTVNYFSWHNAFGKDGRGSFGYVLGNMCFDTNKGPEAFGKVVGYMNSADKLFTGANDKYFAKYEAALKQAINEGKDYPSPGEWARQNAPEMFALPKDAGAFVDKMLEGYSVNADDEAKLAKKASVRTMLLGVLGAEPDSSKWDALAKNAMTVMLGGTFDAKKISEADPQKIINGREIYGTVGGQLDNEAKSYVSSLIFAGDFTLGGQKYKEKKDDKVDEWDAMAGYKEYLKKILGENFSVYKGVVKLQMEMNSQFNSAPRIKATMNGKEVFIVEPAEEAKIRAEYNKKLMPLLHDNIMTPAEFYKQKTDAYAEDSVINVEVTAEKPAAPVKPKAPAKKPAAKTDGDIGTPAAKPADDGKKPKAAPAVPATSGDLPVASGGVADVPPESPDDIVVAQEVTTLTADGKKAMKKVVEKAKNIPKPTSGAYTTEYVTAELSKYAAETLPNGIPETTYLSENNGLNIKVSKVDGKYQTKIVGATKQLKELYHLPDDVVVLPPPTPISSKKGKVR